MIMDDFSVWLIEINSHPDMSYSTSVTARLCRQVMEDTIKVVVDFREDKNADTGYFELAYRQRMPTCQPYFGAPLSLQGTRIITEKKSSLSLDPRANLAVKFPMMKKKSMVHGNIGPVIVDLIEELEIQLDQELLSYHNTVDSLKPKPALPATASAKSSKMSDEKLETVTKSTSADTTSVIKTKSPINIQTKAAKNGKNSSHKSPPRKSRAQFAGTVSGEPNASPTKETLISKIMALQQQTTNTVPKSEKLSRKNEEKIIKSAMRDAAKKYKRNVTMSSEVQPLSSLLTPAAKMTAVSSKGRARNFPKKYAHHKKNKVLTDITDMYAIGLGLTK